MIKQKILDKIIYIFERFEKYILLGFFILFILFASLTIYLNRAGNNYLKKLNTQQINLSKLLGKWNNIKLQQKNVETMLDKNKNFKLGFYINNLIKQKNLEAKTNSPTVQSLGKTLYEEVTQILTVTNSDMQKLVQLLDLIENNELVYIKKLEINAQNKNISFALTLATLQTKVTTNEKS